MRLGGAFLLLAVACSHPARNPAAIASPPNGLQLAGRCGYDNYLNDACGLEFDETPPSFAVVTLRSDDTRAIEKGLRAAPHFRGYPFAATFDDLPAADPSVRGLAVIAGRFRARADADAYARTLGAEVVPLATNDWFARRRAELADAATDLDQERRIHHAIEIADDTPAFARDDLERVEAELDERLADWVPLPAQHLRRTTALAKLSPRCTVAAGRVFVADEAQLYGFMRNYAPVTCDDGREAWVPWRATRLESVVVAGDHGWTIHQVILVECDVPTLETRPLGPAPATLGALMGACSG